MSIVGDAGLTQDTPVQFVVADHSDHLAVRHQRDGPSGAMTYFHCRPHGDLGRSGYDVVSAKSAFVILAAPGAAEGDQTSAATIDSNRCRCAVRVQGQSGVARPVEQESVRVDIGPNPGRTVEVYVKSVMFGAEYITPPLYQLAASLEVPGSGQPEYLGPPIQARLVREGPVPSFTLQVENPNTSQFEVRFDSTRQGEGVTEVRISILPLPTPNPGGLEELTPAPGAISVPLGPEVRPIVEILVDFRPVPGGQPAHVLALTLQRG